MSRNYRSLITRWFFFLLTAGVLMPTTLIIILEVTRRVFITRRGEVQCLGR